MGYRCVGLAFFAQAGADPIGQEADAHIVDDAFGLAMKDGAVSAAMVSCLRSHWRMPASSTR